MSDDVSRSLADDKAMGKGGRQIQRGYSDDTKESSSPQNVQKSPSYDYARSLKTYTERRKVQRKQGRK